MPDALEFPGMLRAIIPLVRPRIALINELVALALGHAAGADEFLRVAAGRIPRFAAVIGALDDLAEPAAALRGVDSIRVQRRAFEMIHFPTGEMRSADFPIFA